MSLKVSVLRFTPSVKGMSHKHARDLTAVGMVLIETQTIHNVRAQNGIGLIRNVVNTSALRVLPSMRRLANVNSITTTNVLLEDF